eukprot:SAG31_NODE_3498_length_4194_cov_2.855922_1_plen_1186_part_10
MMTAAASRIVVVVVPMVFFLSPAAIAAPPLSPAPRPPAAGPHLELAIPPPPCQLSRSWRRTRFPQQPGNNFTIVPASDGVPHHRAPHYNYHLKCVDGHIGDMSCSGDANITMVPLRPGTAAWALGWRHNLSIAFAPGGAAPSNAQQGLLSAGCSLINFWADGIYAGESIRDGRFGQAWCDQPPAPGCNAGGDCFPAACSPPPMPPRFGRSSEAARFWGGPNASVRLMQMSHTDIFFVSNDVLLDGQEIAAALDIMAEQETPGSAAGKLPPLKWNHENILVVRAFIDLYPHREAELVHRMQEGQLDFGGTFTEPFEQTLYNEIAVRQLYEGRKWLTERYPEVDSARTAFQQDAPGKALQMVQLYARAGIRYFKGSRFGNAIFEWRAPDGSKCLAFEQYDYAQADAIGNTEFFDSDTIFHAMELWFDQFQAMGAAPLLPVATGHDNRPPTLFNSSTNNLPGRTKLPFMEEWANRSGAAPFSSGFAPPVLFSHVHEYLDQLRERSGAGFRPPVMQGERPNLWWAETTATHHWLFDHQRTAARNLPAAEAFSSFRALAEGSWESYPDKTLAVAWRNLTLADHGLGEQQLPFQMPCRGENEGNKTKPWTPFLCTLVRPNSPKVADQVYYLKWGSARKVADNLLAEAQTALAQRVNTGSLVSPVLRKEHQQQIWVVFNQLSWKRDGLVEIPKEQLSSLALVAESGAQEAIMSIEVRDGRGSVVPSQLSTNGSLVFIAPAVPSMGWVSFALLPAKTNTRGDATGSGEGPSPGQPWTTAFSNNFFRVTPGKGGLASVIDLSSNTELFNVSGGLLAGEWMSLSYTGTGASENRDYRHTKPCVQGDPSCNVTTMGTERLGNHSGWVGWTCSEAGPVRTVFVSTPVQTRCSIVSYEVKLFASQRRIDYSTHLKNWRNCFGVTNRLNFPIRTKLLPPGSSGGARFERNVSFATVFGVVTVGIDEIENETAWEAQLGAGHGKLDSYLSPPGVEVPGFDRGWAMAPRECLDWFQAEAGNASVMVASSVGLFDWIDRSGQYGADQVVLAPEILMHTNGNAGPFTDETGDHAFEFSIFPTQPGWRRGWRQAVGSRTPLTAIRKTSRPIANGEGEEEAQQKQQHQESLDLWGSFLSLHENATNLWVSTVKREQPMSARWQECPHETALDCAPQRDGLIVRLFDNEGLVDTIDAQLQLFTPVQA